MSQPIVILSGPTASGKTALSLEVAQHLDAVIINADSKQVFREIPILSAQPTASEKGDIPHYLFSCLSIAEDCSVAKWLDMAVNTIENAHSLGKVPLLVGGTGMYIQSLVHGISPIPEIDPEIRNTIRQALEEEGTEALHQKLTEKDTAIAEKLNPGDSQRVARAYEVICSTGRSLLYWQTQPKKQIIDASSCSHFFLHTDREKTYENCNKRFDIMVEDGVLEEAAHVDKMQLSPELPGMRAHGLPELLRYLHNEISLEEAIRLAKRNTRHYIKRQYTWFRSQMPEAFPLHPNPDLPKKEATKALAATLISELQK